MLVEKMLQPMLIGLKLQSSIRTSRRLVAEFAKNSRLRLSWGYLLYSDGETFLWVA